jgi:hypothetical protein
MRNRINRCWIFAYLLGVGALSSGVAVACSYYTSGDFKELPSAFWGAYEDPDCLATWGWPRCGFYMCTSNSCSSVSYVEGCTTASSGDMFMYMQMGCRGEACGMY